MYLSILCVPFGFIAPKHLLKNLASQSFDSLRVLGEGYFRNTSCALNLISTFLF